MDRRAVGCAALALFAVVALSGAGCTRPSTPGTSPVSPGSGVSTPGPGVGGPVKPGLEALGGGRVVAYGWVIRMPLEGGFWAVADMPANAGTPGETPRVVAVLLPGKVPESEFVRLQGSYIGAEGTLQQGASIRMSGPEVVVDAVRMLGRGQ